jgi:hypothetical protein
LSAHTHENEEEDDEEEEDETKFDLPEANMHHTYAKMQAAVGVKVSGS